MSWDDELSDIDTGEEKLTKSRVLHIRIDPEQLRYLRRAALAADKKPCDWVRRAIARAIAAEKSERKAEGK
jgi:hypothetical protein